MVTAPHPELPEVKSQLQVEAANEDEPVIANATIANHEAMRLEQGVFMINSPQTKFCPAGLVTDSAETISLKSEIRAIFILPLFFNELEPVDRNTL